ncbi:MAG: hypothetical protein FJZ86_03250 [Chloroflexi bacterium]|nr:hypothetical protein [Chloroflexota bacterium]
MKTDSSQSMWRPSTKLGWWSVRLAAAFVILMVINNTIFMRLPEDVTWRVTVLPFYGIFMMLCGLTAGIVGLVAVIRQHERSRLVWLTMLPGLFALFFILGEFLVPH